METMSERAYYNVKLSTLPSPFSDMQWSLCTLCFVSRMFSVKLFYVITIFMVLYMLNWTDSIEAPVEEEEDEDNNMTDWMGGTKPALGLAVFVFFVLYGLVYPLYSRLGCCGYHKKVHLPGATVVAFSQDERGGGDSHDYDEQELKHPRAQTLSPKQKAQLIWTFFKIVLFLERADPR